MPATGDLRALRALGLDWGLPKVSGASRPWGLLGGRLVEFGGLLPPNEEGSISPP